MSVTISRPELLEDGDDAGDECDPCPNDPNDNCQGGGGGPPVVISIANSMRNAFPCDTVSFTATCQDPTTCAINWPWPSTFAPCSVRWGNG